MKDLDVFDVVLYEPGDIVIRRNKSRDVFNNAPKPEIVDKVDFLHAENYKYQVLYFKSNPTSAHIAWEYEPYDEEKRKLYVQAMIASGFNDKLNKKRKTSVSSSTKNSREEMKNKINEEFKLKFKSK